MVDALQERKAIEDKRFQEMYQANTTDFHNFDLIIDSTEITPDEIADLIYKYVTAKQETKRTILLSPRRLYPTKHISEIKEESTKELPEVIFDHKTFYIISGHMHCSKMIEQKESLMQVELLDISKNIIEKDQRSVKEVLKNEIEIYKEWEAYHHMNFDEYPVEQDI